MDKDVIYRQDAIDAMWKIRRQLQMLDDTHKADRVMHGIYLAKKALEQLPSAPERKPGKWIYGEHDVTMCDGYRCSNCGFFVPWDYQHKAIDFINDYWFCPSCGADMMEGQDG